MPVELDETDIALLKSLLKDGRKSFRAISREIKISTPTVKTRYERLLNIGLIKSIKPEIDISKIDNKTKREFGSSSYELKSRTKPFFLSDIDSNNLKIKLKCDFCHGDVNCKPKVFKFANFERYFCCIQCRASYKEKYGGRIAILKEQYKHRDHLS